MMPKLLVLAVLVTLVSGAVHCQELESSSGAAGQIGPGPISEGSIFVASPYPALFDEVEVDGFEQLEGAIQVEEKAASVTYAPFLLLGGYNPLFSETRLKVGQKDNLTTVGLQFQYNPLSPRTKKNEALWLAKGAELGVLQDEEFEEIRSRLKAFEVTQEDEEVRLVPAIRVLKNKLLALEQERDMVVPKPTPERMAELAKMIAETQKKLADLKKEAAQARRDELLAAIANLRLRAQAATDPGEKARLLQELDLKNRQLAFGRPESNPEEARMLISTLTARQAELTAAFEKQANSKLLAYYEEIFTSALPIVGLSYNATFFPVLDGGFDDADDDQLNDNEHQLNSRSIALTGDWRIKPRLQLSGLLGYTWKRPAAEKGSLLGESENYSLSLGWIARIINKEFKESDDYKTSFFIPSIVLGIAAEHLRCSSDRSTCVDSIDRQTAITPFVDFKIKKASQFRVGIPFKRTSKVAGSSNDTVEVVSVIAFQLGEPK